MGRTPSSRRQRSTTNSHQRSSRTSVLSPPNRGDQLCANSHPTNTSDFQLSTSHHPKSPTEMQNTDSKWDQSASIRRFKPHRNEHALTATIPHAKTSHHQQ